MRISWLFSLLIRGYLYEKSISPMNWPHSIDNIGILPKFCCFKHSFHRTYTHLCSMTSLSDCSFLLMCFPLRDSCLLSGITSILLSYFASITPCNSHSLESSVCGGLVASYQSAHLHLLRWWWRLWLCALCKRRDYPGDQAFFKLPTISAVLFVALRNLTLPETALGITLP